MKNIINSKYKNSYIYFDNEVSGKDFLNFLKKKKLNYTKIKYFGKFDKQKYYIIKHNNKNDDLRVKTYNCFLAFNFIDIVFYIEIIECFYYESDLFCEEIENFIENNNHSITELYNIENF